MSDLHAALLPALGVVVLERTADGAFARLGDVPAGLAGLFDGGPEAVDVSASAYLAWFLESAEAVWRGERDGPLASGPWTEAGADGEARTLEATALRLGDRDVLLIGPPAFSFPEATRVLQTARELALAAEGERRAASEREVLLHCIVHDLSNPLSGISGSLQILGAGDLDDDNTELLEIASRNVGRMRSMIRSILHTFEAEVAAMLPSATPDRADAAAVLAAAAEAIGPQATVAEVTLEAHVPEAAVPVVGEAVRLERVLLNFLDNALRHTPAGQTVRLFVDEEARETVRLVVEDDGEGVPEAEVGALFQRFSQKGGRRGRVGLGLYFCRIAAEGWGGEAGYEPAPGGGARFWIRLPRAAVTG
ncbi:MAG: HAMP domain-containing sensor histidine kinase [Bacteroidota bacterium]